MIWNTISNDERLRRWKDLRVEIIGLDLDTQLKSVAEFCSDIPYGSRTLDYYSPSDWPTPWEILFYGSFCTSSISLLMFYTLSLIPIKENLEIYLVEDIDGIYLLPIIDNQFVLNYELGKVNSYSDLADSFKVLKRYSRDQIKTIK